jgi:hypothetical protein
VERSGPDQRRWSTTRQETAQLATFKPSSQLLVLAAVLRWTFRCFLNGPNASCFLYQSTVINPCVSLLIQACCSGSMIWLQTHTEL